jgi:predicted transcriptional regulator
MRITDIAKSMELHNPEIRRHLSRLQAISLIQRDLHGFYHLTPFGEIILMQLRELKFTTRYRPYFTSHVLTKLPREMMSRLSDLSTSTFTANLMDFLYQIENIIADSEQYVWLNVAQFPVTTLATTLTALERGVMFRIIEQEDMVAGPHLTLQDLKGSPVLGHVSSTSQIEYRTLPAVDILLLTSEKKCAIAFPQNSREFDYHGFIATDEAALAWCKDLFIHYWDIGNPLQYPTTTKQLHQPHRSRFTQRHPRRMTITGHDDARVDARAVQEAVDMYDEVILSGTFNFGSSSVIISRSVIVSGDGAMEGIPRTSIYKSGWQFPFTTFDAIFKVDGKDAEVTIQNIHFTDFNHLCIWGCNCKKLTIANNRITLLTGYGRGMTFGAFGDVIIGVLIHESQFGAFDGRVLITENYIDFACGGAWGGFLSRGGLEESPEYRPDLLHHEYFMSFGVAIHQSSSVVRIENNVIRNANARGIAATGNFASADIQIRGNDIITDVYGSYPFASPEAGAGILVQSAWGVASPSFAVTIEENSFRAEKLNYSGIIALGPVTDRKGSGKLQDGVIRQNRIYLNAGYEGIHVRKCDNFEIVNNTLLGEMYYGIHISGRQRSKSQDLRALNNVVKHTEMQGIHIRPSDSYTKAHQDGRMFSLRSDNNGTAHVWLDQYTENNSIQLTGNSEIVIDEGKNNIFFDQ